MSLLNTARNIGGIYVEKIMISAVNLEILGTMLQHQCDEQHRPTQHIAAARLTNWFTLSRNLPAPKFTGVNTGHTFFHYNFALERL